MYDDVESDTTFVVSAISFWDVLLYLAWGKNKTNGSAVVGGPT